MRVSKGLEVHNKWEEIKDVIEAIDPDVYKHAKGGHSAGVRVRKALRIIKKLSHEMIMTSIELAHIKRKIIKYKNSKLKKKPKKITGYLKNRKVDATT